MCQTCSKSIFCFVLVNFNLCNNEITNHTNIFKWRYKKTWNHKSIFYWQIVIIFFNSHPITVVFVYFFLTTRWLMGAGGKCPPPHPPGYGHAFLHQLTVQGVVSPHPRPPVAYNFCVSVFSKHLQDRPNNIAPIDEICSLHMQTGLPCWLFSSQIVEICLFWRKLAYEYLVWLLNKIWLFFGCFGL